MAPHCVLPPHSGGVNTAEQALRRHVAACGAVASMLFPAANGVQKRQAWLEFASQHAAKLALGYTHTLLAGSFITVQPSARVIEASPAMKPAEATERSDKLLSGAQREQRHRQRGCQPRV
ncbi:hypothetical protein WJX72_006967 [[Myrmecia] bisecta]|uniref:Uncharacterized protein n=1 Tax=[Myrmecia] bisecta TaxID=41462 RepID=A0AAW1P4H0_9CHLO